MASKKRPIFYVLGAFALAVLVTEIALAIWLPIREKEACEPAEQSPVPSPVKWTSNYSARYGKAAVTTDSGVCASLGREILQQGGNAVDATITTTLCDGVTNMMSCGIGGGSFLLVFDQKKGISKFINCRETAPSSATRDMFNDSIDDSLSGGRSIAVPGEMACFVYAHDNYGKLEWAKVIQPVIDLVRTGVYMSAQMEYWMVTQDEYAHRVEGLTDLLKNPDGNTKRKGDQIVNEKLAVTFEAIRDDKHAFHTKLAEKIVKEINGFGGNFTIDDVKSYEAEVTDLLPFEFDQFIGHVPAPPASGIILSFIVNIMANFKERNELPMDRGVEFQHKLLEAFKFAFGKRSLLGDPAYNNQTEIDELIANLTSYEYASTIASKIKENVLNFEDYEPAFDVVEDSGTSHINVVDENGMACSVTSTVNTILGSKCIGVDTGIIYNNEMNDFSVPGHANDYGVPPSPQNFIAPGKRPLSSMAPVIVTDKNGALKLVTGGSGGTRITTATAQVVIKTLLQNMALNEAVQDARLHHQLMPDEIRIEERFNDDILSELETRGQKRGSIQRNNAVVQAIYVNTTWLDAVSDSRKDGRPDGY